MHDMRGRSSDRTPVRYLQPMLDQCWLTICNARTTPNQHCATTPVNTRHSTNTVSMLAHRLRRWASIETALGEFPVFAGTPVLRGRCVGVMIPRARGHATSTGIQSQCWVNVGVAAYIGPTINKHCVNSTHPICTG